MKEEFRVYVQSEGPPDWDWEGFLEVLLLGGKEVGDRKIRLC